MSEGLGDYQLQGEIGRGGMGIVYQAQDKKIGRTVAIKVIRVDAGASPGDSAKLRQRLVREASAAGRIYHPGIVTVHHLGEYGDNVFVVMEYVDGSSLEHLLANNPVLDRTWTLNILHQIADALDYAHKSGVIHRDVKPANILVRPDGRVKIADFGIAKIASEATAMTATGISLGSPSYMSPEQIQAAQIDGRSDQFALAIIAFQMLTGRMPFKGDTAHTVMYQIVTADPFQQAAEELSLSPAVRQVLGRALAKSPQDRFASCGSFVEALMNAEGVAAQPMQTSTVRVETPAAPAPVQRKKSNAPMLLGGALVLLLVLCGGVFRLLIYPRCCAPQPRTDPRSLLTPLIFAIENGKPEEVDALLTQASANAAAADGTTPVLAAIQYGKLETVKKLLAKGASVNKPGRDGVTPLMAAAEGSAYMPYNLPLVEAVLAANPDIQAQDARGRTALDRAVEQGKVDVAALLLDKGAQIDQRTNDGATPLFIAVVYGKLPVVQLLLDRKAQFDLSNAQGETPLMIAAEGNAYMPNNAPLVEALIAAGAHVDLVDQRGRSPLYRASAEGKEDAMKLLLDHQANPNVRANDRSTPLIEAVTFARLGAAQLLIERGADVNLSDAGGSTPLMIAAEASAYIKDPAVYIKLLLDHGAKADAVDAQGRTALKRATDSKNAAAMEALK